MQKQTLYTLGISTLIFLSACTQNNDSNNNPLSQTLNSEPQSVIPELLVKENDAVVALSKENEVRIKVADEIEMAVAKDQFAGAAALGAVGGYRSIQSEKKYKSRRMIVTHDSLLQNIRQVSERVNRENYAHFDDNSVKRVIENPVSTFSIDVDTGAYSNVRRMLKSGRLPAHDAVRVEEMINYFSYDYPKSKKTNTPFVVLKEIAKSPWNKNNYLLHIGIKAHDVNQKQLPNANLVFLIDVSGSMQSENKLELLKTSLKLLSKQLSKKDKISIVVYAGASGVVLNPTAGDQTATIQAALAKLTAGGSTNGAAGIELAYSLAQQEYIQDGINRVIIATDGDFNVGTVNHEQLMNLI
ncbi:MAG: von Willebrand factor type A domain-containing protein, partial [Gammaproteobacteria bacterium]